MKLVIDPNELIDIINDYLRRSKLIADAANARWHVPHLTQVTLSENKKKLVIEGTFDQEMPVATTIEIEPPPDPDDYD